MLRLKVLPLDLHQELSQASTGLRPSFLPLIPLGVEVFYYQKVPIRCCRQDHQVLPHLRLLHHSIRIRRLDHLNYQLVNHRWVTLSFLLLHLVQFYHLLSHSCFHLLLYQLDPVFILLLAHLYISHRKVLNWLHSKFQLIYKDYWLFQPLGLDVFHDTCSQRCHCQHQTTLQLCITRCFVQSNQLLLLHLSY